MRYQGIERGERWGEKGETILSLVTGCITESRKGKLTGTPTVGDSDSRVIIISPSDVPRSIPVSKLANYGGPPTRLMRLSHIQGVRFWDQIARVSNTEREDEGEKRQRNG